MSGETIMLKPISTSMLKQMNTEALQWLHLLAGRKFALVLVRDQVVSTLRKYVTLNSDFTPKPSRQVFAPLLKKAKASLEIFSGGREKTFILQEVHCLPQAVLIANLGG